MNTQQMMEEIDRLARLCEAKDAENKLLRTLHQKFVGANKVLAEQLSEAQAQIAIQAAEIERLTGRVRLGDTARNARIAYLHQQIAMQSDVLADIIPFIGYQQNVPHLVKRAEDAKEATSETVAAFRAKETEPLRREVAMLREIGEEICKKLEHPTKSVTALDMWHLRDALTYTQATALAYEREVKAKALEDAAKELDDRHLESLQMCILPSTMVREMAAELRTNKGELNER